jgi:predicted PhzF superfamily epimerase YddE/YHI9
MDFPTRPAEAAPPPDGLAEALGCDLRWCGRSAYDWLTEVAHAGVVRGLRPDFSALARLPVRGVIVTARSDAPSFDFVSRFFAPSVGVPEDPVTGSAHCTLASYWSPLLGKLRMRAWQASVRGGEIGVELAGQRVRLSGKAVTVWRGELTGGAA